MSTSPEITALVCTYNRCTDLQELLDSLLAQETRGEFDYEILVVDNGSTDATRSVMQSYVERAPGKIRYLFEDRQGKSYALNTALAVLRTPLYVIADDDLLFPPQTLAELVSAFREYPKAACIGGQVKPQWRRAPPAWLTPHYYSALALTNWGGQPFRAGSDRRVCLMAAGYRTNLVRAVGGYRVDLGVNGKRIGGMEDADLFDRLYDAGHEGRYEPSIEIFHKVEAERVDKGYHRRWHKGHGSQYALVEDTRTQAGRLPIFGTPLYFYRQALRDLGQWAQHKLRGREEAFWYELQLRHFAGYWQQSRRRRSAPQGFTMEANQPRPRSASLLTGS